MTGIRFCEDLSVWITLIYVNRKSTFVMEKRVNTTPAGLPLTLNPV